MGVGEHKPILLTAYHSSFGKPSLESLRDKSMRRLSNRPPLNQRVQAAVEIGRIKDKLGVDPYDPAREEEVLKTSGPEHGTHAGRFFTTIYGK